MQQAWPFTQGNTSVLPLVDDDPPDDEVDEDVPPLLGQGFCVGPASTSVTGQMSSGAASASATASVPASAIAPSEGASPLSVAPTSSTQMFCRASQTKP